MSKKCVFCEKEKEFNFVINIHNSHRKHLYEWSNYTEQCVCFEKGDQGYSDLK